MNGSRVVLLFVFVLVAAGAVDVSATSWSDPNTRGDGESAAAFGVSVSAFVGATAGRTEEVVVQEMWETAYAENRSREAVAARIDELERRRERLADQRERLRRAHAEGRLSDHAYRARLATLSARLDAVIRALEETHAIGAERGRTDESTGGDRIAR
jgi:hypothetical protein